MRSTTIRSRLIVPAGYEYYAGLIGQASIAIDMSKVGQANGTSIVQLTDLSPNANNLTQATVSRRATFVKAGKNGLGIAQFDGVDDCYLKVGDVWPAGDVTLFAVLAPGTSGEYFGQQNAVGGNLAYHFYNNGGTFTRWDSGPNKSGVVAGTWGLFTYYASGSNETLCLNGANPVSGTTRPAVTSRSMSFAALDTTTPTLPQALKLAEFLVIPALLTATQRTVVEGVLRAKWGTP